MDPSRFFIDNILMEKPTLIVCVTGAAGQIGYSLAPLVASGQMFEADQAVELRLLDIPPMAEVLKGLAMELQDCAYPTLRGVKFGSDPKEMFKDADLVLFLGGFPRKQGMERKDLISKNCNIFKEQGVALNEVGKKTSMSLQITRKFSQGRRRRQPCQHQLFNTG